MTIALLIKCVSTYGINIIVECCSDLDRSDQNFYICHNNKNISLLLTISLNPDQAEAPVVGNHQPGEHGHDQARPGVDGEHAGEAGRALDDGVEAGVESVTKDGDGEGQAAPEGPHPARKHLGRDQVHHRVDAKGVGDEHENGDDEGHDAKVEGEEGLPPVGEGSHGSAAEPEQEGAAGKHVAMVRSLQSCRGTA